MNEKYQLVAKTLNGLEELLAEELQALGASNVKVSKRACKFEADLRTMYKINLHSRLSLKVLKHFYNFVAFDEHRLYKKIKSYDWSTILSNEKTFSIDSVVNSKRFKHSKFLALKIKDAIVDQFREETGKRPSIDTHDPDVRINVHCNDTKFNISLDCSGDSLHKRGYRIPGHQAPMNEVLAAGLIKLSEWDGEENFYDLMCGSGTIAIEAALMACNIAPGLIRNSFGFQKWEDFDKTIWKELVSEAKAMRKKPGKIIFASDISEKAVNIARQSIDLAGVKDVIKIQRTSMKDSLPRSQSGMIIINPPYGERLKEEEIIDFYKEIGDVFKQKYTGYTAWVLSGNKTALKHLGLRTSRKLHLFNGSLECKYHKYELY